MNSHFVLNAALLCCLYVTKLGAVESIGPGTPSSLHVLLGAQGEGPNNWIFSIKMGFTLAHWLGRDAKMVLPCIDHKGSMMGVHTDTVAELDFNSTQSSRMLTSECTPFATYYNISSLEAEGITLSAALHRLHQMRETVTFFVVEPDAAFAPNVTDIGDGYAILKSGMVAKREHAVALRLLLDNLGCSMVVVMSEGRMGLSDTRMRLFKRVRSMPSVVLFARWSKHISSGPNGTITQGFRSPHVRSVDEFIPPVDALWATAHAVLSAAALSASFIALHWRVEMMRADRKTVNFCLQKARSAVARELIHLKTNRSSESPLAVAGSGKVLVMTDVPDLHTCGPETVLRSTDNSSCSIWTKWRVEQYASREVRGAFQRLESEDGWVFIKRHIVPNLQRISPELNSLLGQLLVEQLVSAHSEMLVANVANTRSREWMRCSQGRSTASYVMLAQKVIRGVAHQTSW